jgi:hypothetical protein
MNALPGDIVLELARNLGDRDLLNMRLVNRRLEEQTLFCFKKRFFETRYHFLSEHSLRKLREVAGHSVLGQAVRQLKLQAHHRLKRDPDNPVSTSNVDEPRFSRDLDEQNEDILSHYLTLGLADALRCAPGCRTVVVGSWFQARLLKKIGAFKPARDTYPGAFGFSGTMIQIVLAALAVSGDFVKQFGLEVHMEPSILRLCSSYLDGTIFASALQNLHLSLSVPVTHDRETWASDLGRFIMHFNNLEELSLRFDNCLNAEFLKKLHKRFYLPKLRVLKASKVDHGEKEMVNIFMTHQHTLKEVTIDRFNLSTMGSWKWLVDEVQQKLSLTLLMLSHCTVKDRYDLLFLDQPSQSPHANRIIRLRDRMEMIRAIQKMILRIKGRASNLYLSHLENAFLE